ncbi:hypothetical protein [Umezawaea beigongshangensis]|uniref:hypothetical protein n=1 Tax=Umezawaea beigongshangensis TaxID=2780383 RepID=UPI0018F175AE|nr:hypothetical protein [Umezawaea beigongshangensis]
MTAPGVLLVTWRAPSGDTGDLLLVDAAVAAPRWHRLADVLVVDEHVAVQPRSWTLLVVRGPAGCTAVLPDGQRVLTGAHRVEVVAVQALRHLLAGQPPRTLSMRLSRSAAADPDVRAAST